MKVVQGFDSSAAKNILFRISLMYPIQNVFVLELGNLLKSSFELLNAGRVSVLFPRDSRRLQGPI